jgi:hypothetical protein
MKSTVIKPSLDLIDLLKELAVAHLNDCSCWGDTDDDVTCEDANNSISWCRDVVLEIESITTDLFCPDHFDVAVGRELAADVARRLDDEETNERHDTEPPRELRILDLLNELAVAGQNVDSVINDDGTSREDGGRDWGQDEYNASKWHDDVSGRLGRLAVDIFCRGQGSFDAAAGRELAAYIVSQPFYWRRKSYDEVRSRVDRILLGINGAP